MSNNDPAKRASPGSAEAEFNREMRDQERKFNGKRATARRKAAELERRLEGLRKTHQDFDKRKAELATWDSLVQIGQCVGLTRYEAECNADGVTARKNGLRPWPLK